ncbi:methyl-accepting chemotaxis protein [Kushneria indalinina]|uniref:Methyl-accepting chemotaxis protein-2 (Aspartate sensor receptor) n=1 Tax=Kushneria indalinina DSM 14324 TaxID=1122140 RepID=A0A3D9DVT5_9GAMM|nr:Cache 3/Cache 2 fusion domain-containing protein [Kushneria indalinina]REC94464.1 methyl-accepting chemotaxis protein-2 (aspartate sensor receptor) [Kushneria indalinina DSM 14324]
MADYFRRMSIGSRLALVIGLVAIAGFVALSWGLSSSSARTLRTHATHSMKQQTQQFTDSVTLFDQSLQQQSARFLKLFQTEGLAPPFVLDSDQTMDIKSRETPLLMDQRGALNMDTQRVDDFTRRTGTPVTLFARTGDDFVRVNTSLKDAQGERAVGTLLDRNGASYRALMEDRVYSGIATLFGTPYITRYEPIHDARGRVIGASFIGVDITADLENFKARVRSLSIGDNGYFMIVDANDGSVLAGGDHEGASLKEVPDVDGSPAFAPIFQKQQGLFEYQLSDSEHARQTTYFMQYPDWHWVVAATAVNADIDDQIAATRNRFLLIALGLALAAALGVYFMMRRSLSNPLASVQGLAGHLANGDLRQRLDSHRKDEIGSLVGAMNGISDGLRDIVGRVRQSVESIGHASGEIASGNMDLSRRTESQAASLEQTAASIEELTATVRQNTERARQGDSMAGEVVASAREGQQRLGRAMTTLKDLDATASKMSDIIATIDGIAFQTNLLALNASVEAARAGAHGRGFTVVADEVRRLAVRCSEASADIGQLIRHTIEEVTTGNAHIQQSGEQIEEITARMENLGVIVNEISRASEEQLAGIEQVSSALASLDETTQHNAALVEQSAAASGHLDEQARKLSEVVRVFHLPA